MSVHLAKEHNRSRNDSRTKEQRRLEDKVRRTAIRNGAVAKKRGSSYDVYDRPSGELIAGFLSAEQVIDLVTTTTK